LKLARHGDTNACLVRGHHSCFYAVDLPDWIPLDVMQKMVDIFSDLLYPEMTVALTVKKTHKPSLSTQSVMSISSINSVASVEAASPDPGSNILTVLAQ
jgi:hypothetical protein